MSLEPEPEAPKTHWAEPWDYGQLYLLNSNWFWWTSPFAEMTIGIISTVIIRHIAFISSARSLYFVRKGCIQVMVIRMCKIYEFFWLLILSMMIISGLLAKIIRSVTTSRSQYILVASRTGWCSYLYYGSSVVMSLYLSARNWWTIFAEKLYLFKYSVFESREQSEVMRWIVSDSLLQTLHLSLSISSFSMNFL
jgi:hypothetical protein